MRLAIIAVVAMFAPPASGLASVRQACLARTPQPRLSRACSTMLFNSDRSRRAAGAGDRKVTLKKPLGLELVNGPGNSVVVCARARARAPHPRSICKRHAAAHAPP